MKNRWSAARWRLLCPALSQTSRAAVGDQHGACQIPSHCSFPLSKKLALEIVKKNRFFNKRGFQTDSISKKKRQPKRKNEAFATFFVVNECRFVSIYHHFFLPFFATAIKTLHLDKYAMRYNPVENFRS